jgi:hypothetical protein
VKLLQVRHSRIFHSRIFHNRTNDSLVYKDFDRPDHSFWNEGIPCIGECVQAIYRDENIFLIYKRPTAPKSQKVRIRLEQIGQASK